MGRRAKRAEERRLDEATHAAREAAKEERLVALEAANSRLGKKEFVPPYADKYIVGAKAGVDPDANLEYELVPFPEASDMLKSSLGGVFED